MAKPRSHHDYSIQDIQEAIGAMFICGIGGVLIPSDSIDFTVPPSDSLCSGRLVLVTTKAGSIRPSIDNKNHKVTLLVDKTGNENKLLIRVPIGVRLFKVKLSDGFVLYYEAAQDHEILPTYIQMGTDTDQGQKVQEVVLVVSPVPPRDPALATAKMALIELTWQELQTRRAQEGLPPMIA
jgi:hypothetical protein